MPYLIGLVIVLVAANWVRERLGLTWQQFGLVAVIIAVAAVAAVTVIEQAKRKATKARVRLQNFDDLPEATWTQNDDDEAAVTSAPNPGGGPNIAIEYVSGSGNASERQVTIMHVLVAREGLLLAPTYLIGWCHTSQDKRTFRVDRIRAAADPATHQAIDNPALWLMAFGRARPGTLARMRQGLNLSDLNAAAETVFAPEPFLVRLAAMDAATPAVTLTVRQLEIAAGLVLALQGGPENDPALRSYRLSRLRGLAVGAGDAVPLDDVQAALWREAKGRAGRVWRSVPPARPVLPDIAFRQVGDGADGAAPRRVTPIRAEWVQVGLLRDLAVLLAWDHASTQDRRFAVSALLDCKLVDRGEPIADIRVWLLTGLARDPGFIVESGEGGRIELDADTTVTHRLDAVFAVELKPRRSAEWLPVTVGEVQVTEDRLVTALRGVNRETGRARTFALREMEGLRASGSRKRVPPAEIQAWIVERAFPGGKLPSEDDSDGDGA